MRALVVVLISLMAWGMVATAPALAQTDPTPVPVELGDLNDGEFGRIIPRPNSGTAPTGPGQLGGGQQLAILSLIVLFFGVAALSIRRSIRKARAAAPAGTTTGLGGHDVTPPADSPATKD